MSGSDNASLGDLQKQIKDLDNKYEKVLVLASVLVVGILSLVFKAYLS